MKTQTRLKAGAVETDSSLQASSAGHAQPNAFRQGGGPGGAGWTAYSLNIDWANTDNSHFWSGASYQDVTVNSGTFYTGIHEAVLQNTNGHNPYDGTIRFGYNTNQCASIPSSKNSTHVQVCESPHFTANNGYTFVAAYGSHLALGTDTDANTVWTVAGEIDLCWTKANSTVACSTLQ